MNERFRVLGTSGADATRWADLIQRLPAERRDLHFLPEYGRVYEATHGVVARLACLEADQGVVLQPFVVRPLAGLHFLAGQAEAVSASDIANPYGYGGPMFGCDALSDAVALLGRFEHAFLDYCGERKYASEFCSLHPLVDVSAPLAATGLIELRREKDVVYMDLAADEAELWRGLRKGHRSAVTKARRLGVLVTRVDGTADNLAVFKQLYYATMRRNQAAGRWFHPDAYFGNCLEILGDDRASLHFATLDGELAAAAILMHDFDIAYYHFAGSEPRFNHTNAGNLLVYEAALWARRMGYARFHLGGGVSAAADDSLLLFKAGFSELRASLYTYSRPLHQATYRRLSELKLNHEAVTGWTGNPDYFPLYRR